MRDSFSSEYKTLEPIFHLANWFARTDKKVGTVPTCSRRIFSPANFNQSRCRIVFASRRAYKVVKWKIGLRHCNNRRFKTTGASPLPRLDGITAVSSVYRLHTTWILTLSYTQETVYVIISSFNPIYGALEFLIYSFGAVLNSLRSCLFDFRKQIILHLPNDMNWLRRSSYFDIDQDAYLE